MITNSKRRGNRVAGVVLVLAAVLCTPFLDVPKRTSRSLREISEIPNLVSSPYGTREEGTPRDLPPSAAKLPARSPIASSTGSARDSAIQSHFGESYGKLPLSFEANHGQTDSQVKFLSRGRGYTLYLTSSEAVLALRRPTTAKTKLEIPTEATSRPTISDSGLLPSLRNVGKEIEKNQTEVDTIGLKLVGANPQAEISGGNELPGRISYFIGNDPSKWITSVPTYSQARYRGIYPGIDLLYYGNEQQLENDFVVAPGSDLAQIRLKFEGAQKVEVSADGDLLLKTRAGVVRLLKPHVYQEIGGKRHDVAADYFLSADLNVSFALADFDHSAALVIDPVLVYSTALNGNNFAVRASSGMLIWNGRIASLSTFASFFGCVAAVSVMMFSS